MRKHKVIDEQLDLEIGIKIEREIRWNRWTNGFEWCYLNSMEEVNIYIPFMLPFGFSYSVLLLVKQGEMYVREQYNVNEMVHKLKTKY